MMDLCDLPYCEAHQRSDFDAMAFSGVGYMVCRPCREREEIAHRTWPTQRNLEASRNEDIHEQYAGTWVQSLHQEHLGRNLSYLSPHDQMYEHAYRDTSHIAPNDRFLPPPQTFKWSRERLGDPSFPSENGGRMHSQGQERQGDIRHDEKVRAYSQGRMVHVDMNWRRDGSRRSSPSRYDSRSGTSTWYRKHFDDRR